MVMKTLDRNAKPSFAAIQRIAAIKDSQIDYSDIPDSTAGELKEIAKLARENRKKKIFSLRLSIETINWWKETLGEGYTGAMAQLLEAAEEHPNWIEESIKGTKAHP
ncbi:MAG: BrnA antitoxin family protein [Treponema sp.]|jgi:uncharacterized protein (DUF4415 family)|nr:BrnA antitoxin family protein [Treponema sp.]